MITRQLQLQQGCVTRVMIEDGRVRRGEQVYLLDNTNVTCQCKCNNNNNNNDNNNTCVT